MLRFKGRTRRRSGRCEAANDEVCHPRCAFAAGCLPRVQGLLRCSLQAGQEEALHAAARCIA